MVVRRSYRRPNEWEGYLVINENCQEKAMSEPTGLAESHGMSRCLDATKILWKPHESK